MRLWTYFVLAQLGCASPDLGLNSASGPTEMPKSMFFTSMASLDVKKAHIGLPDHERPVRSGEPLTLGLNTHARQLLSVTRMSAAALRTVEALRPSLSDVIYSVTGMQPVVRSRPVAPSSNLSGTHACGGLPDTYFSTPLLTSLQQYYERDAVSVVKYSRSRPNTPRRKLGVDNCRLRAQPATVVLALLGGQVLPQNGSLVYMWSASGITCNVDVTKMGDFFSISASGLDGVAPLGGATNNFTVALTAFASSSNQTEGTIVVAQRGNSANNLTLRVLLVKESAGVALPILLSHDVTNSIQRQTYGDSSFEDVIYDSGGRVQQRWFSGAEDGVIYEYDGANNVISLKDRRAGQLVNEIVMSYGHNNLISGLWVGGIQPVLFGYDSRNLLSTLVYPGSRVLTYNYNNASQLLSVWENGKLQVEYGYFPDGSIRNSTQGNGLLTQATYDSSGQLATLEHVAPGGQLINRFEYSYNGGQLICANRTGRQVSQSNYKYDKAHQLVGVTVPGNSVAYSYDSLGNRISRVDSSSTINYTYTHGILLASAGDEFFVHDKRGRIIERRSAARAVSYSWGRRGLLSGVKIVENNRTTDISFTYDAASLRRSKTVNGLQTRYVYDISRRPALLLLETDASNNILRTFTYGLSRVSQRTNDREDYFLSDRLSVIGISDATSSVSAEWTLDAFGIREGAIGRSPYGFAGEYYDEETGLVYLRDRYYDPSLGRFLSPDPDSGPLTTIQARNPYNYVNNNPLNEIDPSGDSPLAVAGFIVGGIVGVAQQYVGDVAQNYIDGKSGLALFKPPPNSLGNYAIAATVGAVTGALLTIPGAQGAIPGVAKVIATVAKGSRSFVGNVAASGTTNILQQSISDQQFSVPKLALDMTFGGAAAKLGDIFVPFARGPGASPTTFTGILTGKVGSNTVWKPAVSSAGFGSATTVLSKGTESLLFGGARGGVYLSKTAQLLLDFQEVRGAAFDSHSGLLSLFGESDGQSQSVKLPALSLEDVTIAIQSELAGEDPGVSIDPPIVNDQLQVRYLGQTFGTYFGWVLYEADRVLKILMMGKDNLSGASVTAVSTGVPSYRSLVDRLGDDTNSNRCSGQAMSYRMWFEPFEMTLVPSADGQSMIFQAASMTLKQESKRADQVFVDVISQAFTQDIKAHYDDYAVKFPIFRELLRLGKTVAVIKWIVDNKIALDLGFLETLEIRNYVTPLKTPSVRVPVDNPSCQYFMEGGVSFQKPNAYTAATGQAESARNTLTSARPDELTLKWQFPAPTPAVTWTAVSQSLTRSRKTGNLVFVTKDYSIPAPGGKFASFTRAYDSFDENVGPMGRGWSIAPYSLRFPTSKLRLTFGTIVSVLHVQIWLRVVFDDRIEETLFAVVGLDSNRRPIYMPDDGKGDLLFLQPDGSFLLQSSSGDAVSFSSKGQLLSILNSVGHGVLYGYTSTDQLIRISTSAVASQSIDLTYQNITVNVANKSEIWSVVGSVRTAADSAFYNYSSTGCLIAIAFSTGNKLSFECDADGRITRRMTSSSPSFYAVTYDIYNRIATEESLTSGGPQPRGYSLESRTASMVDPTFPTRVSALLFDELYRPTSVTNSLGYVSQTEFNEVGPTLIRDAAGNQAQLEYDVRGNLVRAVDANGNTLDLWYNNQNQLLASRDARGIACAASFNGSQLMALHDQVSLNLDADNNLLSFSFSTDRTTTFRYDTSGNLIGWSDGQFNFFQNVLGNGQPASVSRQNVNDTQPPSNISSTTYNSNGDISTLSMVGVPQVGFQYDPERRLSSITSDGNQLHLAYDKSGNLVNFTDANSAVTLFRYDTNDYLVNLTDPLGYVALFERNRQGLISQILVPSSNFKSKFAYDVLDRQFSSLVGLHDIAQTAPRLFLTISNGLNFLPTELLKSTRVTYAMANLGFSPLTISLSSNSTEYVIDSSSFTLQPGAWIDVAVAFAPADFGPRGGVLTMQSNDPAGNRVLTLVGLGVPGVHNVTARRDGGDGVTVSWNDLPPGTSRHNFSIYREFVKFTGADLVNKFPIATVDGSITSYHDIFLAKGRPLYYAVVTVLDEKVVFGQEAVLEVFGPLGLNSSTSYGSLSALASCSLDKVIRHSMACSPTYCVVAYDRDTDNDGISDDVYVSRISLSPMPAYVDTVHITASIVCCSRGQSSIAYDPVRDQFLVVYTIVTNLLSSGNRSLALQILTSTGVPLGGATTAAVTGFVMTRPEIVYVNNGTFSEWFISVLVQRSGFRVAGVAFAFNSSQFTTIFDFTTDVLEMRGAYDTTHSEIYFVGNVQTNNNLYALTVQKRTLTLAPTPFSSAIISFGSATQATTRLRCLYNVPNDALDVSWNKNVSSLNAQIGLSEVRVTGFSLKLGGAQDKAGESAWVQNPFLVPLSAQASMMFVDSSSTAYTGPFRPSAAGVYDSVFSGITSATPTLPIAQNVGGILVVVFNSDSTLKLQTLEPMQPVLMLSSNTITLATGQSQVMTISNVGTGLLSWSIVIENEMFSASQLSGQTSSSQNVQLACNTTNLPRGSYFHVASIFSDGGFDVVNLECQAANNLPKVALGSELPLNASDQTPLYQLPVLQLGWSFSDIDGDVLSYDVYLSPVLGDVQTMIASSRVAQGLTLATLAVSSVNLYTTSYYWLVAARDGISSALSPVWQFTTVPIPSPLTMVSVPSVLNFEPVLEWSSVPGASGYEVSLGESPSFANNIVAVVVSPRHPTEFNSPSDGKKFWRVCARDHLDRCGSYAFGSPFTLDRVSPEPPLLLPLAEKVATQKPTLSWVEDLDVASVECQCYNSSSLESSDLVFGVVTSALLPCIPANALAEGLYICQARGRDAANNPSNWSVPIEFTVDITPPPTVESLRALAEPGGIRVFFDNPTGELSDSFLIYHRNNDSQPWDMVLTLSNTGNSTYDVLFVYPEAEPHCFSVGVKDVANNEAITVLEACNQTDRIITSLQCNGTVVTFAPTVVHLRASIDQGTRVQFAWDIQGLVMIGSEVHPRITAGGSHNFTVTASNNRGQAQCNVLLLVSTLAPTTGTPTTRPTSIVARPSTVAPTAKIALSDSSHEHPAVLVFAVSAALGLMFS